MKLKIATSQFPVSADISVNKFHVMRQVHQASEAGCDLIHFPECALSGYAGIDMADLSGLDVNALKEATIEIMALAGRSGIWLVLGSTHLLNPNHNPHNSLYIINNKGELVDRYDKRFCAGSKDETEGDLAHFSPGNHECVFEVNGIKCGTIICHEYRYPELYRSLMSKGVQLVFHSYHAGSMNSERQQMMEDQVGEEQFQFNPGRSLPEITMPATMISYAANNALWISCANTSAPQSCWAAFAVRPDGVINGQLMKNEAGILITEIDTAEAYYDSTQDWRDRAVAGEFNSGRLVSDPRSEDRLNL